MEQILIDIMRKIAGASIEFQLISENLDDLYFAVSELKREIEKLNIEKENE